MSVNKSKSHKMIYVIGATLIVLLSVVLSSAFDFGGFQLKAVGLLAAALMLWISNALPMAISTLLIILVLPLLGLMEYNEVMSNFGVGTSLFIMASSGITVGISKSNIPYKITEKVFSKMGDHTVRLVYCFGLCVTVFSGFVSSLATCTLFTALVSTAMRNMKLKGDNSNLSKALMLVIPVCSGIGGFISPAGTPANILVLDLLNKNGMNLSFGQWCVLGLPVCIISAIIFLTFVVLVFKPEKIDFKTALESKKLSKDDFKVLFVVVLVIVGWFLSGFVSRLNITLVAMVGLAIFFVPSMKVITFDQFSQGVNWDLVFTMGSVSVLMIAVANTGVITNAAEFLVPYLSGSGIYLLLVGLSLFICIIRAFVPTTTAVIALLAPMLMSISELSELNFGALLLIAAYWAATALLLIYTEPIFLISYKEGDYKQKDLLKVGLPTNLVLLLLCPIVIYLLFDIVI